MTDYSHWGRSKLLATTIVGNWIALFNSEEARCFKKIAKNTGQLGFSELSAKTYEDSAGTRFNIYELVTLSYEKRYEIKTIDNDLELLALGGKR